MSLTYRANREWSMHVGNFFAHARNRAIIAKEPIKNDQSWILVVLSVINLKILVVGHLDLWLPDFRHQPPDEREINQHERRGGNEDSVVVEDPGDPAAE